MAKSTKHKKLGSSKVTLILTAVVMVILSAMTIGFARYNKILDVNGNVALSPQGEIYISNVVFTGGKNVTSNPTFTNNSINFGLNFYGDSSTTEYTANFDVTITNETFYGQIFAMDYWQPTITDGNGNPVDEAYLDYQLVGIENGDTIPRGESVTFAVQMVLHAEGGNYNVGGDVTVDFTDSNDGTLIAEVVAPTTGDLRGSNERAMFTVRVTNTYDYSQVFNLQLRNNEHFIMTDTNGNALGAFTIGANTEADFPVFVQKASGVDFATDYERANIYLSSTALGDVNCGRITLLVDRSIIYTDDDPPIISNVQMNVLDASGEAKVTWEATDDVTISHFTVLVYDSSNQLIKTIVTDDDTTSATVTGLSNGSYYAKVYGEDSLGNKASDADIANATTSSGYCSRSAAKNLTWTFTITYNLTRLRSSGASTVNRGETYETTLSVTTFGYALPYVENVKVTMGGTTLAQGTGFTYSRTTGRIAIPNVSGNIVITAEARRSGCLIEGTEILLADGSTKKVEDIRYGDLLAVWNYETGQLDAEYPIWIEREHRTDTYQWAHFSDGSDLRTVREHGVFRVDLNQFITVQDAQLFYPGTSYYKVDEQGNLKSVKLESVSTVRETKNYYHVVSARYYNVIANGFITTDGSVGLSNLYGFDKNITWPAARNQILSSPDSTYPYEMFKDVVPEYMYVGMRMGEIRVIENAGFITLDQFKEYLRDNQSSPIMLAKPELMHGSLKQLEAPKLVQNQRVWPVSFGDQVREVAEATTIVVPARGDITAWRNSVDGQIYHAGDRVKIQCGTHFIPLY